MDLNCWRDSGSIKYCRGAQVSVTTITTQTGWEVTSLARWEGDVWSSGLSHHASLLQLTVVWSVFQHFKPAIEGCVSEKLPLYNSSLHQQGGVWAPCNKYFSQDSDVKQYTFNVVVVWLCSCEQVWQKLSLCLLKAGSSDDTEPSVDVCALKELQNFMWTACYRSYIIRGYI